MNQLYFPLPMLYQVIKDKQLDHLTGLTDFQLVELFFKHAFEGAVNQNHPENVFYFVLDILKFYNHVIEELQFILKLQFVPILTEIILQLENILATSFNPTYYFGLGQTIPNAIMIQVNV